ncbi:type II toxin-antitoxin system antitoxin [Streptomyces youssoufiensis]
MTEERPPRRPRQRKQMLLRLDPAVYDALARWAGDELRSANAQIEFLLRRALADAGRLPGDVGAIPRRGRPPKAAHAPEPAADPAPEAPATPDPASGPGPVEPPPEPGPEPGPTEPEPGPAPDA